jgi:hypothetical protein
MISTACPLSLEQITFKKRSTLGVNWWWWWRRWWQWWVVIDTYQGKYIEKKPTVGVEVVAHARLELGHKNEHQQNCILQFHHPSFLLLLLSDRRLGMYAVGSLSHSRG